MARFQHIVGIPALQLQPEWQPFLQFVRFRRRINIQRPVHPHYERDQVIHLTRPIFPELIRKSPSILNLDVCRKQTEINQKQALIENPYERFLAKDLLNWFNHSNMILFFHTNPMSAEERFKAYIALKKQNMALKTYGRKIAQMALESTKFEPVLHLFQSQNAIVFSVEPQVAKLLRLLKKIPQLILMAGVVDGRLLSKNELVRFSQLPDLQLSRAQLVATLNLAANQVVQHLTHHQNTLLGHLHQHVEIQKNDSKTETENTLLGQNVEIQKNESKTETENTDST